MGAALPEKIQRLADHIGRYVSLHPHAADTAFGIRRWWLPSDSREALLEDVEAALEQLAADGRILMVVLPDGTPIYKRLPDDPAHG